MHTLSHATLEQAYERLHSADDTQLLQLLQDLEQAQPMLLLLVRMAELEGLDAARLQLLGRCTLLVHAAMEASGAPWPRLTLDALLAAQQTYLEDCMAQAAADAPRSNWLLQRCLADHAQRPLLELLYSYLDAGLRALPADALDSLLYINAAAIAHVLAQTPPQPAA